MHVAAYQEAALAMFQFFCAKSSEANQEAGGRVIAAASTGKAGKRQVPECLRARIQSDEVAWNDHTVSVRNNSCLWCNVLEAQGKPWGNGSHNCRKVMRYGEERDDGLRDT
eukprot:1424988-Rhodomonas_salina.2